MNLKIKDQILTIGQIRKLQKLGFDVNNYASLCWVKSFDDSENTNLNRILNKEYVEYMEISDFIPTMTSYDIIDILPYKIKFPPDGYYLLEFDKSEVKYIKKLYYLYSCDFMVDPEYDIEYFKGEKLIDKLFNALVWCIENKYIET